MWTDRSIKAIKPRKRAFRASEDTNKRGGGRLVLEVKPNGAKYFFFQYFRKQDGKSRRSFVSIGRFKDSAKSSGFTLSEARDKILEYENVLKQGLDVKLFLDEKKLEEQERLRKIEAAKRQGSFQDLLDSYITAMETDGKRSFKSVEYSLNIYVCTPFPDLIKCKANEIEVDDIRIVLSRMIDKGVTTHTNRVRSYLHAAFQHGLKQDNNPRRYSREGVKFNLKYNPVAFVPIQADYERVGEYVIPEKEIPIIWEELHKKSILASSAVKLALATGQQLGEIIRTRWEDYDLRERTMLIPSSVSKNGVEHLVPLSEIGTTVVKELKNETGDYEYAFPGTKGGKYKGNIHIYNSTVGEAVRKFCINNDKVTKFVPRDIRRTVKTYMGKAGISKELRDRIQNHAMTDVSSKHYDRYDYLKEKRHGLKVWNDYLDLIIHPRKNVTRLKRERA